MDGFLALVTDDALQSVFGVSRADAPSQQPEMGMGDPALTVDGVETVVVEGDTATAEVLKHEGIVNNPQEMIFIKQGDDRVWDSLGSLLPVDVPAGVEAVPLELNGYEFVFDEEALSSGNFALAVGNTGVPVVRLYGPFRSPALLGRSAAIIGLALSVVFANEATVGDTGRTTQSVYALSEPATGSRGAPATGDVRHTASGASAAELVPVGQIGGAMVTVVQDGDLAFVGQGSRVITLDLSIPDRPRLVSRGPLLPDIVTAIALLEEHIVVLMRETGGVIVLDRTDPADLRVVGQTPTWPEEFGARGLAVHANLAVVSGLDVVLTVDLTDVSQPEHLGTLPIERCDAVGIFRGRAVCEGSDALHIIDLSQPELPTLMESVPADADSIAPSDDLIYFGSGFTVAVLDLDQADQKVIHQEPIGRNAWRMVHAGDRLYAAQARSLFALDLADPRSPRLVGTLHQSGEGGGRLDAGMSVSGDILLHASREDALQVFDVSDDRSPEKVGGFGGLTRVNFVSLADGGRAVIDTGEIEVWDLSDPAAGQLMGRSTASELERSPRRIDVLGDLVCAPRQGGATQLFDISDPSTPRLLADIEGAAANGQCLLHGDLALVANQGGLIAVDVSQPSAPRRVGQLTVPNFLANALDAVDTTAFVASNLGLFIIDLSDPSQPRLVSELELPAATHVTVQGRYAYVLLREYGLAVVDVSDPARPLVVSRVDVAIPTMWSLSVAVEGNRAIIPSGDTLQVLDISDPEAPRLIDSVRRSIVESVTIRDGLLAVAEGLGGVALFNLAPEMPTPTPATETPPTEVTPTQPTPTATDATSPQTPTAITGDFPSLFLPALLQ